MSSPSSSTVEHLAWLRREQEALLELLEAPGVLDAAVLACPAWRVRDLVAHLSGVHRWALSQTRTAPDGEPPGEFAPSGSPDMVADYADAAAELRAALAQDHDRPCRTLTGPGTVGWWARRQLHETFVHRLDVEQALGRPGTGEEAVAADTVAEVLDTMLPRQVRLGRAVLPAGVVVDLVSPGSTWRLGAAGPATTTVTGPALVLAQLLWRRTDAADPRLAVTGDPVALQAVLSRALTP